MRKVSACCSKRSSTRKRSPAISFICAFTSAMSLPGFSLNCSEVSMPCWSKRVRAKWMEVIITEASYFIWLTAKTTPGDTNESATKPSVGSSRLTSCP